MGGMIYAYGILVEEPEGRDRSEGLDVRGRILLQWSLGK